MSLMLLVGIFFIFWGLSDLCQADEIELMEREAERRHREMLKEHEKEMKKQAKAFREGVMLLKGERKPSKKTIRYIARDEYGRVIGKEIVEE